MEGSKAPVERVSLNRRKLKQEDLPKEGKEWLLQSVSFSAYIFSACAGWRGNFYLLLKNDFLLQYCPCLRPSKPRTYLLSRLPISCSSE